MIRRLSSCLGFRDLHPTSLGLNRLIRNHNG